MSVKLATLGLLKRKVCRKQRYDVIDSVLDATRKFII